MKPIDSDDLEDDGLFYDKDVGPWAESKAEVVATYADTMATAMKNKWDNRVYIDLFAGAGYGRIKKTGRIVRNAAIRVLEVRDPFDLYILNDINPACADALRLRAERHGPNLDVKCLQFDPNRQIGEILAHLPAPSTENTLLALCFLDPFRAGNLKFETIRSIAGIFVDFIILVPTAMEFRRFESEFREPADRRIADFTGVEDWRDEWCAVDRWVELEPRFRDDFGCYAIRLLSASMAQLGYRQSPIEDAVQVNASRKNLELYRLAFYSRAPQGEALWRKTLRTLRNPTLLF